MSELFFWDSGIPANTASDTEFFVPRPEAITTKSNTDEECEHDEVNDFIKKEIICDVDDDDNYDDVDDDDDYDDVDDDDDYDDIDDDDNYDDVDDDDDYDDVDYGDFDDSGKEGDETIWRDGIQFHRVGSGEDSFYMDDDGDNFWF